MCQLLRRCVQKCLYLTLNTRVTLQFGRMHHPIELYCCRRLFSCYLEVLTPRVRPLATRRDFVMVVFCGRSAVAARRV